jgi:hypothetical protein
VQSTSFEINGPPQAIYGPATKFGGQPVWIGPPRWPLGPEQGSHMRLLCQIALNETLFPGCGGWMACVFPLHPLRARLVATTRSRS